MEIIIKAFIKALAYGLLFMALYSVLSLLGAIPTYFLWNWLMPTLFGVAKVTFWQAWGINFLASILLKSSSVKSDSK